jgi:hypothetical protein
MARIRELVAECAISVAKVVGSVNHDTGRLTCCRQSKKHGVRCRYFTPWSQDLIVCSAIKRQFCRVKRSFSQTPAAMAEDDFFERAVKDGKMWYADAIRAATHMGELDQAIRIIGKSDGVWPEPTADLMIEIAKNTTEWTDSAITSRLVTIVNLFDVTEMASILRVIFTTDVPRKAVWTILRVCASAEVTTLADWRRMVTAACTGLDDDHFDFGVTKSGLEDLFEFRKPIKTCKQVKKALEGTKDSKRVRDDDDDDEREAKRARTA